jgi:hypothetical protein
MNKQLSNFFFKETSKIFSFVVSEHGFTSPQLTIDNKINFVFITFMGKNIAIELILDDRESDISCKIARVFDGKKTTHYALDERGVRVREYLSKLLERRGVRERLFTQVGGLEFRERIKITLEDFAQMLKKHGQDILNDSPTVLD